MKKSKIIIPALAMLVMSTAATVTGTVAWFTMNTTASAEGMVVAAKTNGSLIVKENVKGQLDGNGDPKTASLPGAGDKATKVVFDSTPHAFYPSTHDLSIGTATGLRKVTNGMDVNFETGTAKGATPLTYGAVATTEGADYFFDYGLFVAGDGLEMQNQKLRLTISPATAVTLNMYNALSVDFYGAIVSSADYPAVSSDNYIGTLNLASKKNTLSADSNGVMRPTGAVTEAPANTPTIDLNYVENATAFTIPQSGSGSAYSILMRVYFDGELIDVSKNNFQAQYSPAGDTAVTGSEDYYFYSDQNGTIVDAQVGDIPSAKNWYVVNDNTSTRTYARSIDIGTFTNQGINVSITANTVQNG